MFRIQGIIWDDDSELHIWIRHKVSVSEVEEAVYALKLALRGRNGTYEVYGQPEAGRYLFIVIRILPDDFAGVVTARDMTLMERRRYRQYTLN